MGWPMRTNHSASARWRWASRTSATTSRSVSGVDRSRNCPAATAWSRSRLSRSRSGGGMVPEERGDLVIAPDHRDARPRPHGSVEGVPLVEAFPDLIGGAAYRVDGALDLVA